MSVKFVRPDFSDYVVHFTKDEIPITHTDETIPDLKKISGQSAKERLFSILEQKKLRATRMPWTNKPAACFTECTWSSLMDHANRYSRYGLGFNKGYLFSRGGGPAIYLTPGLMEHQEQHVGKEIDPFAPTLFAFVTPFCPPYAPKKYRERFWPKRKTIDFSHEREWRVPHDLDFELKDVAFVIVARYEDMAQAPKEMKDAIGRGNWLLMDNYARIEQLWPVHRLPDSA